MPPFSMEASEGRRMKAVAPECLEQAGGRKPWNGRDGGALVGWPSAAPIAPGSPRHREGPRLACFDTVIFDLGDVLIPWNPRNLYRKLFADEADMERFLAE